VIPTESSTMNTRLITGLGAVCLAASTLVVASPALASTPASVAASTPSGSAASGPVGLPVAAGITPTGVDGHRATLTIVGTPGADVSLDVDNQWSAPFVVDGTTVEWSAIGTDGTLDVSVAAKAGAVTTVTAWIGSGAHTEVLETTVDRTDERVVGETLRVLSVEDGVARVQVPTTRGVSWSVTDDRSGHYVTGASRGTGEPVVLDLRVTEGSPSSFSFRSGGQVIPFTA